MHKEGNISESLKLFFESKKLEGITASSIADKLDISKKTLSAYINGERYLPIEHLNTICNIFNISADYLLGISSKEQYSNIKKLKKLDAKLIGSRIKEIRKESKLNQENFATSIESNKSSFCRYEKGNNLILTFNLYLLCKNYNISADYLLGKIDTPKYLTKN